MNLAEIIDGLPGKAGAIWTLESARPVRRSYAALFVDVAQTCETLRGWGVMAGTRVGIYAPNSYKWLVYDLALVRLGALSVVFTDDFAGGMGPGLIAQHRLALLLIAKSQARYFPDDPAHVAFIDADNGCVSLLNGGGSAAGGDDELTHVFSSGSAGGLKGLVISRKGVVAALPPIFDAVGLRSGDRLMLFLPLSNFQQRFLCYGAIWYDFDILLTEYSVLFDAMKKLKPTVFLAPPIFYQMIHAEFFKLPAWRQRLEAAVGNLLSAVPFPGLRRNVAKRVFLQFYENFGNDIRILITGMAPIRRNILEFFYRMQLPISETYGMVEAGVMTYRPGASKQFDSVGFTVKGVHFEFGDGDEIICNRQHPVTLRYFQCAEGENEKTFLAPNRISTGDIGKLGANGELYLMGRKKELIVTPGGHKVHPEAIEDKLNNHPDIANAVVFLGREASHLTCVISLNGDRDPEIEARVRKFAQALPDIRKASQFVAVLFSDTAFTRENGMLRPSMKIDRKRITAMFDTP